MIRLKKVILVGLMVLCGAASLAAQDFTDSLTVYFRLSRSAFEPGYMDNKERCDRFLEHVRGLQGHSAYRVYRVDFKGHASPDGPERLNDELARKRAENVVKYLHKKLVFADSVVFVSTVTEDWESLAKMISGDTQLPDREKVLQIVRDEELGKFRERELKNGYPQAWKYMLDKYFPELRNFKIYIQVGFEFDDEPEEIEDIVVESDVFVPVESGDSVAILPLPWRKEMTLKTNAIGWGMGHQNIAMEFDLAPHWALAIPFYYSGGFNYFSPTIKFRGIVVQPEARYYFKPNEGWYLGAHLGVGWYNFALDGDYRIQDHGGVRPAWGGGIGGGYSLQFKKRPAWGMEFAIGAGVYDALYDKFYNEENGPIAETAVRKLFIGVDNVAVSFTYKFGLKRKEGKK